MATMLSGTMSAAKNVVEQAREGAEHAFETAKEGTEHAVSSTRSALLEGIHTLNGIVATARKLDRDDALAWFGLARRTSPFATLAIFAAGVAVGAGVGMLFAPMSGADVRRAILTRLKGSIEQMEDDVKAAEKKVGDMAAKAGEAVKKAEQKVENKANAVASAAKDAVDDHRSTRAEAKQQHAPANGHH